MEEDALSKPGRGRRRRQGGGLAGKLIYDVQRLCIVDAGGSAYGNTLNEARRRR